MSLVACWQAVRPEVVATPELEACLAAALAASRAAYPEVDVADDIAIAHLATALPAGVPVAEALAAACVPDLYLACAILHGHGAALYRFEHAHLAAVDAAIAQLDGGSALRDDVRTAVRERVLAHGGRGKIAEYHGRGDLIGWIRVVALREALQLVRARRREAPLPDDLAERMTVAPPLVSDAEQRIYREAFVSALAALTPRERNLLRQHYLHGATVDELGAFYNVHRATAARWIAQIRETLLRHTRRRVGEALALSGTELDSAMGKAADHLDYSLRHTLSYES